MTWADVSWRLSPLPGRLADRRAGRVLAVSQAGLPVAGLIRQSERVDGTDSVAARIEALGADEVGRRYLPALRSPNESEDAWVVDAVGFGQDLDGGDLPLDVRWELVMAAVEACPDDDDDLWCLGDGPFDELAAEPGMIERFYEERARRPKLRQLFLAMRRELPSEGVTNGWWFD